MGHLLKHKVKRREKTLGHLCKRPESKHIASAVIYSSLKQLRKSLSTEDTSKKERQVHMCSQVPLREKPREY